jgi:hypothetical protein
VTGDEWLLSVALLLGGVHAHSHPPLSRTRTHALASFHISSFLHAVRLTASSTALS